MYININRPQIIHFQDKMPVYSRRCVVSWWFMLCLCLPGKCRSCPPRRGRESASRRAAGAETRADSGGWTGNLERHHHDPVWTHTLNWKNAAWHTFAFIWVTCRISRECDAWDPTKGSDSEEGFFVCVTKPCVLCFSLQRILGVASLDEVLDQGYVNPQNIVHNMTKVNKHGVVTLDDKTSRFIYQHIIT